MADRAKNAAQLSPDHHIAFEEFDEIRAEAFVDWRLQVKNVDFGAMSRQGFYRGQAYARSTTYIY